MISITVLSMACCTGIGVRVFWAPAPHPRARLIPRSARTLCRGSGEGSGQALSHYASRRGQQDQAGTCSAATAGTKEARTRLTLLFACTAVCGAARRGRAHVDSRARCAWSWPQRNMDCPTNAAAGAGSVARWPPSATAGAAAASISITAQAAACVCIGNASVPFCTNHFFHNTLDTRQRHIRKYSNTLGSSNYTANFLISAKSQERYDGFQVWRDKRYVPECALCTARTHAECAMCTICTRAGHPRQSPRQVVLVCTFP